MSWLTIAVLVVVAFLVLKFFVKPLFKIVGIVVLVVIAWWILKGF